MASTGMLGTWAVGTIIDMRDGTGKIILQLEVTADGVVQVPSMIYREPDELSGQQSVLARQVLTPRE